MSPKKDTIEQLQTELQCCRYQYINYIIFQQMGEPQEIAFKPSFFIKSFIGYIYFMQGVYLSLVSVVVYLFPVFPNPQVLSNFSIAALPFSFKYITAPIVEKWTIRSYGRRKFWISLSLFATSILTYPLAMIADSQDDYLTTIAILFVIVVFISMGDVGIDAASVVELEDPVLAGYLQAGMQPLGGIVGSFLMLKVSNPTFWAFLGIQGPICTTKTFLLIISAVGFVIALLVHFFYKERVPQEDKEDPIPEFKTIAKYYLHFVKPKYTLCRHVVYFLVIFQGLKFFRLTYGIEAIYRGFSKQSKADLETTCVIIGILVNTILRKFITKENTYNFIMTFYFIELIVCTALFWFDSFDEIVVHSTTFVLLMLNYMRFLVHSAMINSFGHSQFAGLCLTTLASFVNLGSSPWLQLKLNGAYGYYPTVLGGLIYAWIVGVGLKSFMEWMKGGEPEQKHHEDHELHEKTN